MFSICRLKSLLGKKDVVIVDLRDDDFIDYIPGAINVPSNTWNSEEDIKDRLHSRLESTNCSKCVFHCFESQIRGPSAGKLEFRV